MSRTPVDRLHVGDTLHGQPFLLRSKQLAIGRNGVPYLRVNLADRTGVIPGIQFDASPPAADALDEGQGVAVWGRVDEYRGQIQVNIDRIGPIALADLQEFLPTALRPMADMLDEFEATLASIEDPFLSALLTAIFDDDQELRTTFHQAPAAKTYHHACIGGLLEHTLSVVRMVETAATLYPDLDRDLAVTAAILHDIGKIWSYDPVSFQMTPRGSLLSHVYMGAAYIERRIEQIDSFPADTAMRLLHALLAHHGRLEFGSPVVPQTLEAMVLHSADKLDGDARGAVDHYARSDSNNAFSDYSTMHETRLYQGGTDD
jgi:3'-5' exoribonuclease